jgi:hypothetical protein
VVSLVAGFGMDTFVVLETAGPRIAVGGVNHPFACEGRGHPVTSKGSTHSLTWRLQSKNGFLINKEKTSHSTTDRYNLGTTFRRALGIWCMGTS